ncbi:MAG: fimbrillin family protein [Bacteroidales bacterium]|nr:fimbrillin family protein [Bacteroidales bacterium]
MKNFIKYFPAVLLIAFSISCTREIDSEKSNGRHSREGVINFSLGTPDTKTAYGEQAGDKSWPVKWVAGDAIRIFCNEADDSGPKDAVYSVNPSNYAAQNPSATTLATPADPLLWNGNGGQHNFYAVYPSSGVSVNSSGKATFPLVTNQVCTISSDAENGLYTAAPDMSNAYMVATTATSYNSSVSLNFNPIMTTLDITVKGPSGSNMSAITLTGVSVVSTVNNSEEARAGQFAYNIGSGQMVETGVSGTTTLTTFASVVDNRGGTAKNYIDLDNGESVKLTVFLPPCAINATYSAQIHLHAQANNGTDAIQNFVTLGTEGKVVAASSKRAVILPEIGSYSNANNWITPLDDDIYVSQLSIPGTHDAATSSITVIGRTQDYTIADQLTIGIRAFDLRPTIEGKVESVIPYVYKYYMDEIYHGILGTGVSFESAINTIADYLDANPREFAIIITRYESDRWLVGAPDEATYIQTMQTFLANNSRYQSHKVEFKPDLTIGEMRGKILIISRNNLGPNSTIGTAYTGWNHSNTSRNYHAISGSGGTGRIYVQDMYSPGEYGDSNDNNGYLSRKVELVKDMLDLAATFKAENGTQNYWMINHCAGYTHINNYANNAKTVSQEAYNYIVGNDKAVGPAGIVMMDFAGIRTISYFPVSGNFNINYSVYGDLLPQAVIDNNYKFHLARKTTR